MFTTECSHLKAKLRFFMKILFCAPQAFFEARGTSINICNVVRVLGESGNQVDLLCYSEGRDLEMDNVGIIRIPRFPGIKNVSLMNSLTKVPLNFLMMIKAFGLCLLNKYDVIHAVDESAFFCVFLKKIFKTKFVYDMDSVISERLRHLGFTASKPFFALAEYLEALSIQNADLVLTVCESMSDSVVNRYQDAKIVQIEDAPLHSKFHSDPDGAERLRRDLGLEGRRTVVYTGNLEPYQGIELLVRATAQLLKSAPDVSVVIVGGESEQIARLKMVATNLNIGPACVFTGERPLNEMAAFMTLADVLVSPRIRGDHTAMKIYTYMQSSRPIVATNLLTHTQVLDSECAFMVSPHIDDLASGILLALKDPDSNKSIVDEADRRVSSLYSLPRFNNKIRTAYQSLTM